MRAILPIVALTALAVLSTSCFNPDYSNIVYKCSAEKPGCPEGHACTGGLCQPIADGSTGTDAGADLMSESGCADKGGTAVGPNAYACPGLFNKGQAASRCAQGWHLCDKAAGIDLAKCNGLSGFFVAEAPGARIVVVQPEDALCQASDGANPVRLFFGCGKLQSYTYDATAPGCMGFNRVWDCVAPWDCDTGVTPHTLSNANHGTGSESDGLLCCRQ